MDLAGNGGGRHGAPANRLWPWALRILSLMGGREPHELNLPPVYHGCDYYQNIPIDSSSYVFSPGYELDTTFPEGIACRWQTETPKNSHLEVDCMDFRVGKRDFMSKNCTSDRLLVSTTGDPAMKDAELYCGEGNFMATSVRNKIVLVFLADYENDPMDRFLCSIKVVRDEPPACDCGQWNQVRILGGIEAGVNEFPMMAAISHRTKRFPLCGATIISRRYAVTAAHCFPGEDPDPTRIGLLVGEHDLSMDEDTPSAKLYNITQIIIHPNYEYLKKGNDIALVKVGETDADGILFSNNVGPVCLPFRFLTESFSGETVGALGWGQLGYREDESDVLMIAYLSVVPIQSCINKFYGRVDHKQICTYDKGSDTCKGDSGGPLIWLDRSNERIHILGIVSYGVTCGFNLPSINTRVTSFLDWIVLATNEEFCVA